MSDLHEMLHRLVTARADSLQFRPGQPPLLFIRGEPSPLPGPPLSPALVSTLMETVVDPDQLALLVARGQADGAYEIADLGRFHYRVRRLPEGMAVAFRPVEIHRGQRTGPTPTQPTAPATPSAAPLPGASAAPPPGAPAVSLPAAPAAPPAPAPAPSPPTPPRAARAPIASPLESIDDPAWLRPFRRATTIHHLLYAMVETHAADLVLSTGRPPRVRKVGEYREVEGIAIDQDRLLDALGDQITPARRHRLETEGSLDLGFELPTDTAHHRFRVNLFRTMSGLAAAFRPIWSQIPDLDTLGLPAQIEDLIEFPYGLVLVAGPTGAGKSTTLSALVERINRTRRRHVITLEDPVEYLFRDRLSIIHQREVGVHVESFPAGLRAALREAPDVILLGEMRDLDTIAAAITAAETGHLVLSTLHSGSASQAIDRMIDVFPEHQQQQIRTQLADVLRAVLVQRLLVTGDGTRRVPVVELVRVNYAIAAMIRERRTHQFATTIMSGRKEGMLPFDHSLAELVRAGEIDPDAAMRAARDPNYFRRALDGSSG